MIVCVTPWPNMNCVGDKTFSFMFLVSQDVMTWHDLCAKMFWPGMTPVSWCFDLALPLCDRMLWPGMTSVSSCFDLAWCQCVKMLWPGMIPVCQDVVTWDDTSVSKCDLAWPLRVKDVLTWRDNSVLRCFGLAWHVFIKMFWPGMTHVCQSGIKCHETCQNIDMNSDTNILLTFELDDYEILTSHEPCVTSYHTRSSHACSCGCLMLWHDRTAVMTYFKLHISDGKIWFLHNVQ